MDEKQIWLLNLPMNHFDFHMIWRWGQSLACVTWITNYCSQFVHLRAPEPLRERHCWDTPGPWAEQSLYWKVSNLQCHFCQRIGLDIEKGCMTLQWNHHQVCHLKISTIFLWQVVGTLPNDKRGHEAVKDWLPRGVGSRVHWGTRASAITVLQAYLSVVFWCVSRRFDRHSDNSWHGPMKEMTWYLDKFNNWIASAHCIVHCLCCCQYSYVVRIGGLALFPGVLPFSSIFSVRISSRICWKRRWKSHLDDFDIDIFWCQTFWDINLA